MTALLLAIASGILFAAALPPRDFEPLGWLALVPLLAAVSRLHRPLWAMGLGFLTGIVSGVAQVGFQGSGASMHYAYVPYIWLALVIGAVCSVATWARLRGPEGGGQWVLLVACAGVAFEWITTLTPLPVTLAVCQHRTLPVIQIASLTGIWGVAFLLWGVNAALADALLHRRVTKPALWLVGLAVANALAGAFVLRPGTQDGPSLKVAAIQDWTGQESAADPAAPPPPEEVPDAVALMREAAGSGAKLIVGTENGFGTTFRPNDPRDELNRLAAETGAYLVVGHEMPADPKPFNCASLIASDGSTLGTHHKIKLFLGERQMMQAGDQATAHETPFGRVGLLICFDSCFPQVFRQTVRDGARIVAMPNYDPPTPRASLHHLHVALLPFRAVENRVAFVRADPNGRSFVMDPQGRIVAEMPLYRNGALTADVVLGDGHGTLYTRFGDWFAYLCLAVSVILAGGRRPSASRPAPVSAGQETPERGET
jgi:apolipoprotein N-acyltransferase